MVLELHLGIV